MEDLPSKNLKKPPSKKKKDPPASKKISPPLEDHPSKPYWKVDERHGEYFIHPHSSSVKTSISKDLLPLIIPSSFISLKGSQRQARVNSIDAVSVANVNFMDDGSSGTVRLKDQVKEVISRFGCNGE